MNVTIIGAGMAGLWAAVAAARRRAELQADDITIRLINATDYHSVRVRNYEPDLAATLYPLSALLAPINVELVVAPVQRIVPDERRIETDQGVYQYDALILAAGSQLALPNIPGIEHAYNIDHYNQARRLRAHLATDLSGPIMVVGSGFTGLELVTELASEQPERQYILVDRHAIGHQLGEQPQPYLQQALTSLHITLLAEKSVS